MPTTHTAAQTDAPRLDAAPFRAIVGERLSLSRSEREAHGRGAAMGETHAPDLVVWPETTEETAALVRLAKSLGMPIIPHGAGSSLEGHLHALSGGLCIDLTRMDRVLEVNAEDLDCHVQAGVTREALNAHLRDQGLFFPLDPGANATLGGMAATRASGTNAVRYGTMREVTMGLTVVTAEGDVIRTGGRARKSSAGYDLTRLYVGSEGTLGVITELRLRLFGIPERIVAGVCQFETMAEAVEAVALILQMNVPVARIEFLDALSMRGSIAYSKLEGYEEKPTLFFEFHGSAAGVEEQIRIAGQVMADLNGRLQTAATLEARNQLWKARHDAYWAGRALNPGFEAYVTDACVPMSRLADVLGGATDDAARAGLAAPMLGHVGDGNFHALILFDPSDSQSRMRAEALNESIARRAIQAGGTCTGEHGVGRHKLGLMAEEHGEDAVDIMRRIKRALDPSNLMNPGKTIPGV